MRTRIFLMLVGLALFTASCATGGPGGATGVNRNLITREQMLEANASTAYDAVQKLNPSWFTSRGPVSMTDMTPTTVSVYMSGSQVGDAEYLRNLRPDDLKELRYYESGEASVRFGMGHQRG